MDAGIEVRDGQSAAELERPGATVGRPDDHGVIDEVDRDLERRAVVMQPPRRETSHVDVQRDVPPVVARRRGRQPDLADDLAVEMQRVLRCAPVGQMQLRQRHASGDHERDVVDVAPAPVLAGFSGASDRVSRAAGMGRGVPVRRAVAASDPAAGLTHAQMHPCPPDREAILAPGDLVGQLGQLDAVRVRADRAHLASASSKAAAS